jgi:integrase/recombinase XerC
MNTAATSNMLKVPIGAAAIATKLGNRSFRATGITAYLKNRGTLEKAIQVANHASARTRGCPGVC